MMFLAEMNLMEITRELVVFLRELQEALRTLPRKALAGAEGLSEKRKSDAGQCS